MAHGICGTDYPQGQVQVRCFELLHGMSLVNLYCEKVSSQRSTMYSHTADFCCICVKRLGSSIDCVASAAKRGKHKMHCIRVEIDCLHVTYGIDSDDVLMAFVKW